MHKKLNQEKSIVLIGFMGAGKTTTGKEIARKFNRQFIDIDEQIEKYFNMPTTEIFKKHGEKVFRHTEKSLITKFCKEKGKVISVGGGAFLQEEVKQICLSESTVIFLNLSYESWKLRLSLLIDSRPILQGKNMDQIKELFQQRQPIYADHHIKINMDDLTVTEAVERIGEILNL